RRFTEAEVKSLVERLVRAESLRQFEFVCARFGQLSACGSERFSFALVEGDARILDEIEVSFAPVRCRNRYSDQNAVALADDRSVIQIVGKTRQHIDH